MSKSILIIEDERDLRELLVESLRETGIQETIFETNDPMNGLELFNKHKQHIGLVICDQYMPYANGTEICEIIKRERADVQILIFTGDKSFRLDNAENEYINGIFYKPEGLHDLCQYIKSHFDIKKSVPVPSIIDPLEILKKFIILKDKFPGLILDHTTNEIICICTKEIDCLSGEIIHYKIQNNTQVQWSGKIESILEVEKNLVKLKLVGCTFLSN